MSGKSILLALAVIAGATSAGQVHAAPQCPVALEEKAETYTDHIRTWTKLLYFYRHYVICDNGAPAEGVSDRVAKLMRYHWSGIADVRDVLVREPGFRTFVLNHVDETWDSEDFAASEENASAHCPRGLETFCKAVAHELHEMRTHPEKY